MKVTEQLLANDIEPILYLILRIRYRKITSSFASPPAITSTHLHTPSKTNQL